MSLGEQLDGAQLVRYDAESELTFAWFGGHGVHVYRDSGDEVEFFSIGDFARDTVTPDEAIAAIKDKITEYREMD